MDENTLPLSARCLFNRPLRSVSLPEILRAISLSIIPFSSFPRPTAPLGWPYSTSTSCSVADALKTLAPAFRSDFARTRSQNLH